MEFKIAQEISHLSDDQIEDLYSKYLNGEKNKDLISIFNIDINPNKLISVIPPIKHEDKLCPYCNKHMFSKRKSKSSGSWDVPPIECFVCHHKEIENDRYGFDQHCSCFKCTELRREEELLRKQKLKKKIFSLYDAGNSALCLYSELTFTQKLSLITIFKVQTDECFEYIQSIDDPRKNARLSPTPQMDAEIIDDLYQQNIILVDPNSDISAFSETDDYRSFYVEKVQWIVNLTLDGNNREDLDKIFNVLYNDFFSTIQPSWKDDVYEFLFRVAREEIMQYVDVKADELKVQFSAEKKTREVIMQLLLEFSISEIYYFVRKSVEEAHIFYSKGISRGKRHAANTIPAKMLALGERAISENWDTYKNGRDSRSPRSTISIVFHDLLFQGDDDGFTKSPKKHWDQELLPKYFFTLDSAESKVFCKTCGSFTITQKMVDLMIIIKCTDCGSVSKYICE